MELKVQCGDTIAIPNGCKAIVKDGSVVFEKEQKFKNGDILAYVDYEDFHCPFIYKDTDTRGYYQFYIGLNTSRNICLSDDVYKRWGNGALRYATNKEKQILFAKMREKGLKWNAEEKRVKKIRWRAKKGEVYWYVTSSCSVAGDFMREENSLTGEGALEDWAGYNHFRKKAQAAEAAKRMKEVLRKYHEEIGE
ncbi:hypothetical protein [Segatella oulorum]|uniref:hypothetical protein n=1 Tax=Segatella oulorum TaxID=28136 RepID=UPI0028E696AB|nr:hypothetical protein [Segatella oulorum]